MDAGRELDTLIAERVMGINIFKEYTPGYSTDIAAAWTVVEYFKGQPFTQRMAFFDALGFLCQRHEGQGSTEAFPHAMRNITPENICLAALKAVEHHR